MRGRPVCKTHRGMAPQVRAKAATVLTGQQAERLAMASGPRRPAHEILLDALHLADVRAQHAEDAGWPDVAALRTKATDLARVALDNGPIVAVGGG